MCLKQKDVCLSKGLKGLRTAICYKIWEVRGSGREDVSEGLFQKVSGCCWKANFACDIFNGSNEATPIRVFFQLFCAKTESIPIK